MLNNEDLNSMHDLSKLIICIPTFRREHPAVLSMIRYTPNLTFHFCVRRSEYEAGYYNKPQFDLLNVKFMLLDEPKCIGETREQILQKSIEQGYEYCFMLDDTQFGLHDTTNRITTLKTILSNCLDRFDNDEYKDKAFAFIFSRKSFTNTPKKCKTYFLSQLCQTYIIKLETVQKYDLHFKPMNVVGVEDLTFYYEAANKGLIALSDTRFIRIGLMPSVKKEGGCHVGNEKRNEQDVQNERFRILTNYFKEQGYDKPFLQRVDSVLYPGTFYYKFNTTYAKKYFIANPDDFD